jgi:hypothetical protein
MSLVIGDESGFPKRCFTLHSVASKDTLAVTRTFCITWLQWPTFLWRPRPGPGPDLGLHIDGADPQVLDELQMVDTMTWLSRKIGLRFAQAFQPLAEEHLAAIQKRLPDGLSLQGAHEH